MAGQLDISHCVNELLPFPCQPHNRSLPVRETPDFLVNSIQDRINSWSVFLPPVIPEHLPELSGDVNPVWYVFSRCPMAGHLSESFRLDFVSQVGVHNLSIFTMVPVSPLVSHCAYCHLIRGSPSGSALSSWKESAMQSLRCLSAAMLLSSLSNR